MFPFCRIPHYETARVIAARSMEKTTSAMKYEDTGPFAKKLTASVKSICQKYEGERYSIAEPALKHTLKSALLPVPSFRGSPDHISVTFESRSGNPQLLHFVDQSSALQAKFGGCAFWPANHPAHRFKRAQNQNTFGIS